MFLKGLTFKQAKDALDSGTNPIFRSMEQVPELPAWKDRKSNEDKYPLMREAVLGAYRGQYPNYLVERGFSIEAMKRFEIGYDTQRYKIVLPVRDYKKRLVGLTYRIDFDQDKDQPAKYWHDNFLKSYHLYGLHLVYQKKIKRLFLVEGQLDAVRMCQLGYYAVAVMGSDLSNEQVSLIIRHCRAEQIVLAFDNDEAGEKCRHIAMTKLVPTAYGPTLAVMKYPGKDPGALTEADRLTLIPWYRTSLFRDPRTC
jgi:DNA primase